jgi:hypothetical protein
MKGKEKKEKKEHAGELAKAILSHAFWHMAMTRFPPPPRILSSFSGRRGWGMSLCYPTHVLYVQHWMEMRTVFTDLQVK